MSDDFNSEDYNEKAFGSDNDEGASIRTSESDEGTRYEADSNGKREIEHDSAQGNNNSNGHYNNVQPDLDNSADQYAAQADDQDNRGGGRADSDQPDNNNKKGVVEGSTENDGSPDGSGRSKSNQEEEDNGTTNGRDMGGTAIIGGRDISQCTKQVTINECRPFYETNN